MEGNTGVNFCGLGWDSNLLDMTPKPQASKGKEVNWTSKLKIFVHERH